MNKTARQGMKGVPLKLVRHAFLWWAALGSSRVDCHDARPGRARADGHAPGLVSLWALAARYCFQ